MRQYQPIWLKLKHDGTVSVTINRHLHSRLIKAVTKEKWMDILYKFEIHPYSSTLDISITGAVITFTLITIQLSKINSTFLESSQPTTKDPNHEHIL